MNEKTRSSSQTINDNSAVGFKQEDVEGQRPKGLKREMNTRQVSMIAIAGTIGTGLFLGTGKTLATGGPGGMIIAYIICGLIVYATMITLGETVTYLPTAGSFTDYAHRFIGESYGFSLAWNYWFNNAVTLAADLTAAQILLEYWTAAAFPDFPVWIISLVFLVILLGLNAIHVRGYAEGEYWMSILKVLTIIVFFVTGVLVNVGISSSGRYIGFSNWQIEGAPFVGGFGGFVSVFITATYSYAGTESIGITAGETKNPRKNMPKVIRNVFYRIMVFYVLAIFLIGLNVPYNQEGLENGDNGGSSPFTMIFEMTGLRIAAHIINAVVLTSALSAGNMALYTGTRLLYALAERGHAPKIFGRLNRYGTPVYSVFATSVIALICFGFSAAKIANGALWVWLQNIVGVSTQFAWLSIGIIALRFRRAMAAQGRPVSDLPYINKFYPYGPIFIIFINAVLILSQGWSSFDGGFDVTTFLSFYIQIPVFILVIALHYFIARPRALKYHEMDLDEGRYFDTPEDEEENRKDAQEKHDRGPKFWLKKLLWFLI